MFPLPILTYVKIFAVAIVIFGSWYNGYSIGYSKLTTYKLEQEAATRAKEAEQQIATDQIKKDKDEKIKAINTQLVDAVSELRKRPSRTAETTNGKGCNGASLYAEDSEFLVREAARADEIRVALQACYAQYDAVSK